MITLGDFIDLIDYGVKLRIIENDHELFTCVSESTVLFHYSNRKVKSIYPSFEQKMLEVFIEKTA